MDWIVKTYGRGLTRQTCSKHLNELAVDGLADAIDAGIDRAKMWFPLTRQVSDDTSPDSPPEGVSDRRRRRLSYRRRRQVDTSATRRATVHHRGRPASSDRRKPMTEIANGDLADRARANARNSLDVDRRGWLVAAVAIAETLTGTAAAQVIAEAPIPAGVRDRRRPAARRARRRRLARRGAGWQTVGTPGAALRPPRMVQTNEHDSC